MIPLGVGRWWMQGLFMVRKWPVHPVSAMAEEWGGVQLLSGVTWLKLGVNAPVVKHHLVAAPICQRFLSLSLTLPPMGLSLVAAF